MFAEVEQYYTSEVEQNMSSAMAELYQRLVEVPMSTQLWNNSFYVVQGIKQLTSGNLIQTLPNINNPLRLDRSNKTQTDNNTGSLQQAIPSVKRPLGQVCGTNST